MVAATKTLPELLDQLDPNCAIRLTKIMRRSLRRANKRALRTRKQFALEEIIIPEGRHKGELLREEFQPFAIDLLDQMDKTPHRRYAISGCVQSGKTLIALVVNLCWHLFELGHTVIYGVPEMKMAKKKWLKEILPVIMANPKFRKMLPDKGSGSQGGFDGTIEFKNGATLEFMGATGNDSRRSSSTAQVLMKTEVDKMDEASEGSREASPAETMEDRVASYGDMAYIYEECTRSTTKGRINLQVNKGTRHRRHGKCPHCGEYVYPERQHFVGYEDCKDVIEARNSGTFICPECSAVISEDQRRQMQEDGISVARTQKITIGSDGCALMEGDLPKTDIFSYEWGAFQNRFWSTSKIAGWEWQTLTGENTDDGEKQAKQKRWSEPVEPSTFELEPLTNQDIYLRHSLYRRGEVPPDAVAITAGIDIRKTQLHYCVVAWRLNGSGHIVDYGIYDVPWLDLGERMAIPDAMVCLAKERFAPGYQVAVEDGQPARRLPVSYKLYDGGYMIDSVREGIRRIANSKINRARVVFGRGQSEPPGRGAYTHPSSTTDAKPWIGEQCYLALREDGSLDLFANSDEWKSFARQAIRPDTPPGVPGAITAWEPVTADEKRLVRDFGKQIRAESQYVKKVPRRGEVICWNHDSGASNHWGDAFYYACVASQLHGIKIAVSPTKTISIHEQIASQPVVGGNIRKE